MTPEEKQKEKARLQELVNVFTRKAMQGSPCIYFQDGFGARAISQYRIDTNLEFLMVSPPHGQQRAFVTCPICSIQDIYSVVEDGQGNFPAEVLRALMPGEMELLLMVVYKSSTDSILRFCILEESTESRDAFLECMRILCIYAQATLGSS